MTTDTMTHCGIPTEQPKEWAPMTEREHKLVDWIRLHGTRTSRDLAALLGITVDATGKLLNKLSERGIVCRTADGKAWRA